MKYIIYILFFVCIGISVKAQVPTGFPSQRWAGWIEPTYVVPDSGSVITKRDTSFIPRFVGTTVTWQRPGIDTTFWFWNGAHWGRVTLAQLDTTSLSNRINLKLNISDTAAMLLPYLRKADTLNKWVQNIYARNDSLFKLKNGTETFVHIFPTSGSGTVTSVALSMPAAFTVSGSPITTSGTFNISGAGTSSQYIRGDGTLATMDTSSIPSFFTKVRSEFSATSPITYNSTTGIFGILNANASGQKGAATFNNSDFYDNGSGTIFIRNIPGNWCNIVKYGADTTGVVDASPIIQSLINGGACKVIYGPHGQYKLNSSIQLKDSITITGDGKSTVFMLPTNAPGFACKWSLGGSYTTFTNFSMQGVYNGDSTTGNSQDGILLDSALGTYITNVSAYKLSGYFVHFKHTGKVYAAIANQVIGNLADSSYGGIKADTTAEYNLVSSNIMHATHIGIFVAGGNNSILSNRTVYADYGLYLTGGANNAHSIVSGNTFNHSTGVGIFITGVTNGQNFTGNIVRNNTRNEIYMENSDNIWFVSCDIGGASDSIVSVNCTNSNFAYNKYWGFTGLVKSPEFMNWKIVGDTPTVTGSAYTKNAISLYDAIDNKKFDIIHVNNVVDMSTTGLGKIRLNDSVIVGGILSGSERAGGSLQLLPTSNSITGTTGYIYIGKNSAAKDSVSANRESFLGVGTNTFNGYNLEVSGRKHGSIYLNIHNDSSDVFSAATIRLSQGQGHQALLEIVDQNYTLGGVKPDITLLQNTSGTGGLKLVSLTGPIEIGSSNVTNTNVWARYINGNTTINPPGAATDNGHRLQNYGATTLNKDSVPIVTSLTSQFLLLLDTANNNLIERSASSVLGNTLYTGDGTANNRTVTVTGSTMTFTSALTSPTPTLTVNNTSSGHGVLGSASGAGYGVYGSGFRGVYGTGTGGGTGVYGQETSGIGVRSVVTTGTSLEVDHTPTSFNDVQQGILISRTTSGNSGNGANGIGTYIAFAAPTTTTTSASIGGTLNWYWSTATNASRSGAFKLQTVTNAGALTDKMIVGDNFTLNTTTAVWQKVDGTVPYTSAIGLTSANNWQFGYTPTPNVFSKGNGITIDTNNNVSLGQGILSSSAPLYATGGSTLATGFQSSQGNFFVVSTITAGTTSISNQNYFVQCDASGGNVIINLPAASTVFGASMGVKYVFFRTDATGNTVTINRAGSDTINGATSFTLTTQYQTKQLQCTSASTWAQY